MPPPPSMSCAPADSGGDAPFENKAPEIKIPVKDSWGILSEEESGFILRTLLTKKHYEDVRCLQFVATYLECNNVSEAARAAGLKPSQGRYLRGRPDIHNAIVKLREKAVLKFGFDAEEVVAGVREMTLVDPLEIYDDNGALRPLKEWPAHARRSLKKIETKELFGEDENGIQTVVGYIRKVEFYDKLKASEMLGSEVDTFKKTVKHEVGPTKQMADILLNAEARAEQRAIERSKREMIDVTPKKED